MRKLCIAFVAVAILLSWSGTANATSYGTLTATWGGVDPGTEVHKVTSPGINGNIYVGRYSLKNVGSQTWVDMAPATNPVPPLPTTLQIYCVDTYQWANTGTSIYSITDLADAPVRNSGSSISMGAEKAKYVNDLIYQRYDTANDPVTKAVFAACLWEIVNEDKAAYGWNVSTGNMTVALTAPEKTMAAEWLGLLNGNDHGVIAYALSNTSNQDFAIVLSSGGELVPEPLTLLGMFGGLVGVGGYIRRRRLALA